MSRPPAFSTHLPRFAGEFVVIVMGVLVALAVDEVRSSRADAAKAEVYLEQLRVEVSELADTILFEERRYRRARDAGALLAVALKAPPSAPTDSMDLWFIDLLWGDTRDPSLATVETLVSSGDLLLFDDPELRSAMVRFQLASSSRIRGADFANGLLIDGWRQILGQFDATQLVPIQYDVEGIPDFQPLDWNAAATDLEFRNGIAGMVNASRNQVDGIVAVRRALERLADALPPAGSQ